MKVKNYTINPKYVVRISDVECNEHGYYFNIYFVDGFSITIDGDDKIDLEKQIEDIVKYM